MNEDELLLQHGIKKHIVHIAKTGFATDWERTANTVDEAVSKAETYIFKDSEFHKQESTEILAYEKLDNDVIVGWDIELYEDENWF